MKINWSKSLGLLAFGLSVVKLAIDNKVEANNRKTLKKEVLDELLSEMKKEG